MTLRTLSLPWPPAVLNPNGRAHWSARAGAVARYRRDCFLLAREAGWNKDAGQRLALVADKAGTGLLLRLDFLPRQNRARDDDNLVAAFKAGRDGVAEALGINDSLFATFPKIQPVPECAARRGTVELRIEVLK